MKKVSFDENYLLSLQNPSFMRAIKGFIQVTLIQLLFHTIISWKRSAQKIKSYT